MNTQGKTITFDATGDDHITHYSTCETFQVTQDETYGYLKLHAHEDTTESLAESMSLAGLAKLAADLLASGQVSPRQAS